MKALDKTVLLAAVSLALTVSILTALHPEACTSCLVASFLVSSISFSWAGVAFYSVLAFFILLPFPRVQRAILPMLSFATGAHGVLLFILLGSGHTCWLCVAAGSGVGAAFCFESLRQRGEFVLMALWLAIGAVTTAGMIEAGQFYEERQKAAALATATQDATAHVQVVRGKASMVIYSLPGCHNCELFETTDIPRIRAEFGDAVTLKFLEAPPYLPVPAIFIFPGPSLFLGPPSYQELRDTLDQAITVSRTPESD